MSHKIDGIGVYPLKIVTKDGKIINSKCNETTFRCKPAVKVRMEPRVEYRLVCEVEIDNIHDINKTTIEGSVKRTFGPKIDKMPLAEKKIAQPPGPYTKICRQWWDWPNYPNWKQIGEYHVCIKMNYRKAAGGKAEEAAKKTMPVIFEKTDYEHNIYDIDRDC